MDRVTGPTNSPLWESNQLLQDYTVSTKRNEAPPHNIDAEKALLGSYLLRPDKLDDPASRVEADDFYIPVHVAIYKGIIKAHESGTKIDAVTALDLIVAHDKRDEQEANALALALLQSTPHAESAPYYASIVREHAIRRNGMARAPELSALFASDADPEAIRAARDSIPDPTTGPRRQRIAYRTASTVARRPVEWLWPRRIPLGKLTMIAGDPGLGKSFLTIDIAARVTTGRPWIDASDFAPAKGDVILLSAEDDLEDTIRPRLDEAGGDPRRVHVVDGIEAGARRGERPRSFYLETDLPVLETMLDDFPETRLIVIDPISAYGNGSTDGHKNNDVRAQLAGLSKLAEGRKVAIVVVSHLNKSAVGKALYRVSGSGAYTAAPRIAWIVSKDPDEESRRLFVFLKSNITKDPGGLAFEVEYRGDDYPGRLIWEPDTIDVRADDLVSHDKRDDSDTTAREEAETFLREELANKSRPAKELIDEWTNGRAGSKRTLDRGRKSIGVEAFRPEVPGPWWWRLPNIAKPADSPPSPKCGNLGNLAENTGVLPKSEANIAKVANPKEQATLAVPDDGFDDDASFSTDQF